MKMKRIYIGTIACCLSFTAISLTTTAQIKSLPKQEQEHILVVAEDEVKSDSKLETLSGINLQPIEKGNFKLDFSQELEEDALLSITDSQGKVVFKKPLKATDNKSAWSYNVGKLRPSTYLIEVKTSDTTYWTKFKVGK
jgi:hypothetical protein